MDVELYEAVLSYNRGKRLSKTRQYGYDEAQLALRQDMAAGRLVWYGVWWQDWWCFLRNTHPVFAAFASHQLHVVGKMERYWIYLMLIWFYWLMAALAVESHECLVEPTCDQVARANSTESFLHHVTLLAVDMSPGALGTWTGRDLRHGKEPPDMYMCCLCQDLGVTHLYGASGPFAVSAVFAVLTVITGQVWFLMAACGCCQRQLPRVRHRWERLAHVTLFASGLVLLVLFCVAYQYMRRAGLLAESWLQFAAVKTVSILGAFIFQSLIFFALYRQQRNAAPEDLARRFHVTVDDVRKCAHVVQRLGLDPLPTQFRLLNDALPDPRKAAARWDRTVRAMSVPQLSRGALAAIAAVWAVALALATVSFVAFQIEHHRLSYPEIYHGHHGQPLARPFPGESALASLAQTTTRGAVDGMERMAPESGPKGVEKAITIAEGELGPRTSRAQATLRAHEKRAHTTGRPPGDLDLLRL